MAAIGINVSDPGQTVGTMSGGQKKPCHCPCDLLWCQSTDLGRTDVALGQKQQPEVLKTIRKVQQHGDIAIILITHNEIHARLIMTRSYPRGVIGSGRQDEMDGGGSTLDGRRCRAGRFGNRTRRLSWIKASIEGKMMNVERLTTAQALVKWLVAQKVETATGVGHCSLAYLRFWAR